MGTGRDDFTKDTIRRAAMRVGYHCSYPGCNAVTVGASIEHSDTPAVLGDGAHICAAAEGGPRFDSNMTKDERRSIDNCIWLCKAHARLIDVDPEHYPAELLRSWKASAEAKSAEALANTDYFSEYYKSNQNNMTVIAQLFDDMVVDGQFEQLHTMICQYKDGQLSEVYDELISRYTIIYDTYCCRARLDDDLNKYISLPCKNGAEELAKLFIAFLMRDELRKIQEYCKSEELKRLVSLVISGELDASLFTNDGNRATIGTKQEYFKVIEKAAANCLRIKRIAWAIDQEGMPFKVYDDEFYYKTIAATYALTARYQHDNASLEDICSGDDFAFIKEAITKIKCLDLELQEYVWSVVLRLLATDERQFDLYYCDCPEQLKEVASIRKAKYINMINACNPSLNIDELARFAEDSGDYDVLIMYLSKHEAMAAAYLDEHSYLLAKDSQLLFFRLITLTDLPEERRRLILRKYSDRYENDFLYHCLLADTSDDDTEINIQLNWLKQNQIKAVMSYFLFYISVLRKNKRWDDIYDISKRDAYYSNECLYQLATCLATSENKHYYSHINELYEKLIICRKWKRRGIFFNSGLINQRIGKIESAKGYYQREYDEYEDSAALIQLVSLRIETNDFKDDLYLSRLKGLNNFRAQNLIGTVYLKLKNYTEARKYFIRSLLLDDKDNPSINGLLQISLISNKNDLPEMVQQDTVCTLENKNGTIRIAIHAHSVIEGLVPNRFADCIHVSDEDPSVSQLLFHNSGDQVEFKSQKYTISSLCSVDEWFSKVAFSFMMSQSGTITIFGSTPEEALERITEVVSSSSHNLNQIIKEYNKADVRWPLTVLSRNAGKGILATCEFLAYENSDRIRNNLNEVAEEAGAPTFVLAYECIVFMAHLGLSTQDFGEIKLICASQVRNQLINDVNEELQTLNSSNYAANMFFKEGKLGIFEYTPDVRRARLAFLTKLKSIAERIDCPKTSYDYQPNSQEYKDAFSDLILQNNLLCESGTLGLAQNTENAIVVTDDQFLYNVASLERIPSVGLTGLLAKVFSDWNQLLSISKLLHGINFVNYLPYFFYKRMVDALISNEADIDKGIEEIRGWIRSDTDGDPTSNHESVILYLTRGVLESRAEYLDPDNYLFRTSLSIIEKRKPGIIQESINAVFQMMGLVFQQDAENKLVNDGTDNEV